MLSYRTYLQLHRQNQLLFYVLEASELRRLFLSGSGLKVKYRGEGGRFGYFFDSCWRDIGQWIYHCIRVALLGSCVDRGSAFVESDEEGSGL